jgi:TonB family protein
MFMEFEMTRERFIGVFGAGFFCLLLFLGMLYVSIRSEVSLEEDGVMVSFGTFAVPSSFFTSVNKTHTTAERLPAVRPEKGPAAEVIKGDEPSATVDDGTRKELEAARLEAERAREARLASEARAAAERRKLEEIQSRVSGAFKQLGSESSAGAADNSGGLAGNPGGSSADGVSAAGGGFGRFDLAGRSLAGAMPRPSYVESEEGRIVIAITVDPSGKVISAEVGRGTNIDSRTMRQEALSAARRTRFNSIPENNNQSGTITYHYSLH